ncbi:MAG: hypothetical protein HC868_02055 [Sphingomonadales bacterium]|nr:hypothetical protein [Sphingomonadales bacterium]
MAATLEEHLFAPGAKRLLSLDGGGVKGIISIAFLEKVEVLLRERLGRGSDFQLHDYFDLVGGTSTGSLLATLIALGYPVADIKKMYLEWAPAIFSRPWLGYWPFGPRFSSRGLKMRVRQVLGDRTLESADLRTGLAIITKRIDTGSPWVLTNNPKAKYWNDARDGSYMGNRYYRLADLVCASAAAPYYFAPKRLRMVHKGKSRIEDERGVQHKIEDTHGIFIDGGVSPFNNPALTLLMLAGIRSYGFRWNLDANSLLLVSVGTGSYRMGLKPGFWTRRIPVLFAARALQGLISDADVLSLTLLQWLSAPQRPWEINSEIKDLAGELLSQVDQQGGGKPLLSFVRYDVRLEEKWLASNCQELGETLTEEFVEGLQQIDRADMMKRMHRVGALAATAQVTLNDFPAIFAPS